MKRYNPKEIEAKWQKKWADQELYLAREDSEKPKKYIIDMFPYPSGAAMHVGHIRNFTISDVLSQYHRQKGYNVMHTMGWDTFGSPAENYAIKTGVNPQESTKANIAKFKEQLQLLGISYDWSREITTTDPEYYRWTQWIFLQLFKKGLAYQKESLQWWCNECKTVLANEQVINGCCWRHEETPVIKKNTTQWFFKITAYADQLLDGIEDLDWPEKIKSMQRNWIGRSNGAEVNFKLANSEKVVKVFTTRPDTLFGATFLVLAPEHKYVKDITTTEQKNKVDKYIDESLKKSDIDRMNTSRDKTGVFTGAYAINPLTNTEIPIWIADYVLTGYGTGAIMAVPAHDERDHEFAHKFNLPIIRVIQNDIPDDQCTSGEGTMINSGIYDGIDSNSARDKIVADLAEDKNAKEVVNYRMRDWLISRQRYWGAPIPIVYCDKDGIVDVPEDQLPIVLPAVTDFAPSDNGKSALANVKEWVQTTCPKCGGPAKRETDTMDGYACSSWYYLRYTDPHNDKQAWDPKKANYWLPIDYYCGGDHAVSHLLYSRFWMYFFADQGWIEKSRREPVGKLVYNGYILAADGNKMSKSKGNVVNPDELIAQGYGADALRLFEMFIAPYDQATSWNINGVPGTYRFLQRYWTLVQEFQGAEPTTGVSNKELLKIIHQTIKKVSEDLDNLSFNTAVAALMECMNSLYKIKVIDNFSSEEWKQVLCWFAQLLAPFAPHVSEELWNQLGNNGSIHSAVWPVHDERYLSSDIMTIVVQVNGKVRAQLKMQTNATKDQIVVKAKADVHVQEYLAEKIIQREIYIPNKLVNFVV